MRRRPFSGIELREDILFEQGREESLDQVLGLFVGAPPLDADVFVGRFPVDRGNGGERGRPVGCRSVDERLAGGGELMLRSADGGIGIVRHASSLAHIQSPQCHAQLHVHSAVYGQHLAGDVGGIFAGQKFTAAAISSGLPMRPSGTEARIFCLHVLAAGPPSCRWRCTRARPRSL